MKRITLLSLIAAFSSTALAAPETYVIDGPHTLPRFSYSHFGYSTQLSRFDKTSGKIVLDRQAKTGSVEVTIDTTSVNTGYPLFNEHIQGEDFLHTAKYPKATFISNKLTFEGENLVTVDGTMLHQDHLGNHGDLRSGGAQWMTAGRGIIHSEMPQQESGRMRGFQLWINLPAQEKMKPASYQDILPEEIPRLNLPGVGEVKIIAGIAEIDGKTLAGPIQGISTEPLFLDIRLQAGGHFNLSINTGHNAFVYPYEGQVEIGPANQKRPLEAQSAGVLSMGDYLEIQAGDHAAAFLLLAARPLREPVVQYGPFVMNTREEIEQAMADYKNGQLV